MSHESNAMISGGLGAAWSAFVLESLSHMTSWLTVMTAIIFCDLFSGLARSVRQGTKVRFSKAVRDTLSKLLVYFSAVVAACMVEVANGDDMGIDKWCCLLVCLIEGFSIINNILGYHGYVLDFNKVVGIFLKKRFEVEMDESDGVIKKAPKPGRDARGRFVKRDK